jgi:hypothetical protein
MIQYSDLVSGLVGGSNGQVLFNDNDVINGASNFYFNKATNRVGIGTSTPGSELHIDGHVGFGASLKITTDKVGGVAYAQMVSDYVTGFEQNQYGGPGWGWPNWTTTRAGGTAAAPTAASSNYGLNEYSIWSYDGTAGGQAYSMMTRTAENWTPTAHGIYTTFSTTVIGATSISERMRFTSTGNLQVNNNLLLGTSTDAGYRLDVNGTARIQSSLYVTGIAGTGGTQNFMSSNNDMSFGTGYYFRMVATSTGKQVFGSTYDGSTSTAYSDVRFLIGGLITPHISSQLEVASTTKGFLPPRMTSAKRTAIATPATGLMVYQTDGTEGLYIYKSTGWVLNS